MYSGVSTTRSQQVNYSSDIDAVNTRVTMLNDDTVALSQSFTTFQTQVNAQLATAEELKQMVDDMKVLKAEVEAYKKAAEDAAKAVADAQPPIGDSSTYYTKTEIDEKFVTIASITSTAEEHKGSYIFPQWGDVYTQTALDETFTQINQKIDDIEADIYIVDPDTNAVSLNFVIPAQFDALMTDLYIDDEITGEKIINVAPASVVGQLNAIIADLYLENEAGELFKNWPSLAEFDEATAMQRIKFYALAAVFDDNYEPQTVFDDNYVKSYFTLKNTYIDPVTLNPLYSVWETALNMRHKTIKRMAMEGIFKDNYEKLEIYDTDYVKSYFIPRKEHYNVALLKDIPTLWDTIVDMYQDRFPRFERIQRIALDALFNDPYEKYTDFYGDEHGVERAFLPQLDNRTDTVWHKTLNTWYKPGILAMLDQYYTRKVVDPGTGTGTGDGTGTGTVDLSTYATITYVEQNYYKKTDFNIQDYAKTEDIPVIPDPIDTSNFALKTDIPVIPDPIDTSNFALKSDIPVIPDPIDTSNFALKSDIPAPIDTSNFALKTDIPPLIDTSEFALKSDIPAPVDISGFVRLDDPLGTPSFSYNFNMMIADMNFATEEYADARYVSFNQVVFQMFQDYYNKASVDELLAGIQPPSIDLTSYVTTAALVPYAKTVDLVPYALTADLAPYAKTVDLAPYAKTVDLAPYAKTVDLAPYALTTDLATYAQVIDATYAKLANFDSYAKLTDLNGYALTTDLNVYLKAEDLTSYAKTEDLADFLKADALTVYEKIVDHNEEVKTLTTDIATNSSTILDISNRFGYNDFTKYSFSVRIGDPDNFTGTIQCPVTCAWPGLVAFKTKLKTNNCLLQVQFPIGYGLSDYGYVPIHVLANDASIVSADLQNDMQLPVIARNSCQSQVMEVHIEEVQSGTFDIRVFFMLMKFNWA